MSPVMPVNNRVRVLNTHTHTNPKHRTACFLRPGCKHPRAFNYIPSQTDLLLAGGGRGGGGGCTSWIK